MPKVRPQFTNEEKLRELTLYICLSSESDTQFGSVKLNKLLFFADFVSYLERGKAITEQEYQKLQNGPAARIMKPLLDDMETRKELVIAERNYHGHVQKKPIALRPPHLSRFTAEDIALVDAAIRHFWHRSATEISSESHEFVGWKLADEKETIPYSSALLDNRELTAEEKIWARELDLIGIAELLVDVA